MVTALSSVRVFPPTDAAPPGGRCPPASHDDRWQCTRSLISRGSRQTIVHAEDMRLTSYREQTIPSRKWQKLPGREEGHTPALGEARRRYMRRPYLPWPWVSRTTRRAWASA